MQGKQTPFSPQWLFGFGQGARPQAWAVGLIPGAPIATLNERFSGAKWLAGAADRALEMFLSTAVDLGGEPGLVGLKVWAILRLRPPAKGALAAQRGQRTI